VIRIGYDFKPPGFVSTILENPTVAAVLPNRISLEYNCTANVNSWMSLLARGTLLMGSAVFREPSTVYMQNSKKLHP
jgi:hypothetical protein